MNRPYIALVGRPNTGKSTLFNRLAGRRISIVEDTPGVTRDRIIAEANWFGSDFFIIDTGGIEPRSDDTILKQMRTQAMLAVEMADVIVFVADAKDGVTANDKEVATMIIKSGKPTVLAVNKIDDDSHLSSLYEFYELGLGEPFRLSAEHGSGMGDIMERAISLVPEEKKFYETEYTDKIAVVGKPNAGKSTLINALIGEQRVIVSDISGTTRDAVDTQFSYNERNYLLIDTAGIKHKSKKDTDIDYYSMLRAVKAIERSDICLIVIDGQIGITEQDVKIAGIVKEQCKAIIIVINKWDLVPKETNTMEKMKKEILKRLYFVDFAPVVFISAIDNKRVEKLMPNIQKVLSEYSKRISTGLINDVIGDAVLMNSPVVKKNRQLKIYYSNQVATRPPSIVMFVNDETLSTKQYEKYIEGRLRKAFDFIGTPIKFIMRSKSDKDNIKK